jgi:SAM-dependent methyltransferase
MQDQAINPVSVFTALRSKGNQDALFSLLSTRLGFAISGLLDSSYFLESGTTHFDAVAGDYLQQVARTEHMIAALEWQVRSLPYILDAFRGTLASLDEIVVADLGAGAGAISSWPIVSALARFGLHERLDWRCYDLSKEMKKYTRLIRRDSVPEGIANIFQDSLDPVLASLRAATYTRADVTARSFARDEAVNAHVAVSSFMFHHLSIQGKYEAAGALYSSLRPGGIAIFVDEYRTFEQNLQEMAEAKERGIPYALESFMDRLWYGDLFRNVFPFIEHKTYVSPSNRFISFILQRRLEPGPGHAK